MYGVDQVKQKGNECGYRFQKSGQACSKVTPHSGPHCKHNDLISLTYGLLNSCKYMLSMKCPLSLGKTP